MSGIIIYNNNKGAWPLLQFSRGKGYMSYQSWYTNRGLYSD